MGFRWPASGLGADAPECNSYYTLAVFADAGGGRKQANCVAIAGIMLDDWGTKATDGAQSLAPSYALETSPGNRQAVYLFKEPVTDLDSVGRLHQSLVARGLCDPGAQSPATRYCRLPNGVNGKPSAGGHRCRIDLWQPTVRYEMSEVAAAFGVDMTAPARPAHAHTPAPDLDSLAPGELLGLAADLKSALECVPMETRDEWISVGHALKGLGELGRQLWDEASSKSEKYDPDAQERWHGFSADRTGHAAVFTRAKSYGWVNPRRRVALNAATVFGLTPSGLDGLPAQPDAPSAPTTAAMTVRTGETFLSAAAQAELFKGHIYIVDCHKVLCPGGRLLTADRFKALFGGFTFVMDSRNERVTRNAFEAFTESQILAAPKADTTCFRPMLPYGHIVQEPGRTLANTFWPVVIRRVPGDSGRFLSHVRKLFPAERDFQITMAYLASCTQYPGHKFQWALLLQGVEGNGKTLLSRCVAFALGARYVHWPKAEKLNAHFNAWLVGKLLICVEDVFTSENVDVFEALKPMITGDCLEIEGKGVDQISADVCCNLILNTNHIVGGLRKTRNDRRLCVLHGAQQSAEDLVRDGMGGHYMADIYTWLKRDDGYAVVAELLHTWPIPPEFDPTKLCQTAPWTTSTEDAIVAGYGVAEQAVVEAVEQGEVGFRGGWISSTYLDRLLVRIRKDTSVPPNRRKALLATLGYRPVAALAVNRGRTNHPVLPDAARPHLFVRDEALVAGLASGAVGAAYAAAQGVTT